MWVHVFRYVKDGNHSASGWFAFPCHHHVKRCLVVEISFGLISGSFPFVTTLAALSGEQTKFFAHASIINRENMMVCYTQFRIKCVPSYTPEMKRMMLKEDVTYIYCTTCQHSRRAHGVGYWCSKRRLEVASIKQTCDLYRRKGNHQFERRL